MAVHEASVVGVWVCKSKCGCNKSQVDLGWHSSTMSGTLTYLAIWRTTVERLPMGSVDMHLRISTQTVLRVSIARRIPLCARLGLPTVASVVRRPRSSMAAATS